MVNVDETFPTLKDALGKHPDAYVAIQQMGHCQCCGKWQDLRCGACFTCSDHVDGKKIPGGHELWDTRNPIKRWKVLAQ